MSVRYTVQKAAHKIESALAVIEAKEDIGFAVNDLREARQVLESLLKEIARDANQESAQDL